MQATRMIAVLLSFFAFGVHAMDLKIMSWNVYMLPKPIKFSQQRERARVIVENLRKLDHDIIVLQEAFTCPFNCRLQDELSDKWPHQRTLGKSGYWKQVMNSGVTILSRHPFDVIGLDFYDQCAISDCFASKGVILLEVKLPQGLIQLAATHMQAGSEYKNVRRSQLAQIKRLLDQKKKEGVPQLLVGDLNINALRGEEFSMALKQLEMENHPLSGELQSSKSQVTECLGQKNSRSESWLDHLLVRSNGSSLKLTEKKIRLIQDYVKGQWCDLSDHRPVEAVFTL